MVINAPKVKVNKTEYDKLKKEFEIFDNPQKMIEFCILCAIGSDSKHSIDAVMRWVLSKAKQYDDFSTDSLIAKIEEKYQERR